MALKSSNGRSKRDFRKELIVLFSSPSWSTNKKIQYIVEQWLITKTMKSKVIAKVKTWRTKSAETIPPSLQSTHLKINWKYCNIWGIKSVRILGNTFYN